MIRFKLVARAVLFLMCWPFSQVLAQVLPGDLTTLSMEALMNVEVMSASKKPERYFDAAAAMYVITPEDIRRSGVTNIPDALRMVPGVSVQKVNSHAWDISARGFNASVFANKMLVLIDGRAVYTPLYGGVFWDSQDVVLEDIERIEVIRGPGGTLWGANAVNGVINIITKKAKDTQGTLISTGGGNEERAFSTVRYGSKYKDWYYRAYAKYFDRDEGFRVTGTANDEWEMARGGFRAEKDQLNFQGDFYQGQLGQRTSLTSFTSPFTAIIDKPNYVQGANLLTQYEEDDWLIKGYWDMTDRDFQSFSERRNVIDTEYNRRIHATENQEMVWGAGYRLQLEDIRSTDTISFDSPAQLDQLFSVFAQDEIKMLEDKLRFIVGSKLEHNIYTTFEVEPNVRLSYDLTSKSMVWAAASRAVRTPARLEIDGAITSYSSTSGFTRTQGNSDLSSEKMLGYELGYRNQLRENILVDLAVYTNHYDDIITYTRGGTVTDRGQSVFLIPTVNGIDGDVHGIELSSDVKLQEWWKIKGSYTFSKMNLGTHTDISNLGLETALEESLPRHIAYFRSSFDLPQQFQLDSTIRYSDSITNGRVPSSTQLDLNLTKTLHQWEIAIVGQNLLRPHYRESVLSSSTQIDRSFLAKVTRRF